MKIALSWLREFVELTESTEELRVILDDLGLVVEGIEFVGEGLEDVVVVRIDEIRAIEGADRVRLVIVDAGDGPLEIVCGAMNIDLGDHVPLGAGRRGLARGLRDRPSSRCAASRQTACCARRESWDSVTTTADSWCSMSSSTRSSAKACLNALAITPDVVFDITVEGNRPDAWSVEGVARDLATRLGRPLAAPPLAVTER